MPCAKSLTQWTLSDILGQRRLLGFGALLAWLVLFHLLVNVWLLCIFTSLLVVLGGWLGSRAVLDANSLLHLEHFLPLGTVSPPLNSPEHEWRLNHEIHSAVQKAVRDFVSSWYRTLLPGVEGEFERAVCDSMLDSVMELKQRAQRVDIKALVQRLLELFGCHLQSYMTARHIQSAQKETISLWKLYSEVDTPHPAVSSAARELNYSRGLVNLVLRVLVPYPQMETRTGGYVVTELITCNVLVPLIGRVSDPDWLNQTIVDVITRSMEPPELSVDDLPAAALYACQIQKESWATCKSMSSSDQEDLNSKCSLDPDESPSQDSVCERDSSQGSVASLLSGGKADDCRTGVLTPCKVNCCSLTPGQLSFSSEPKMVSVESLINSDSGDNLKRGFCDCGHPKNFCDMIAASPEEAFGCFGPLKNLGSKAVAPEDFHWPAGIGQEKPTTPQKTHLNLSPCNFDAVSNQSTAATIQNVQISGTITAMEQRASGIHPYTLYTVKVMSATASFKLRLMCIMSKQHNLCSLFHSLRHWAKQKMAALCKRRPVIPSTAGTASSSTCKHGWRTILMSKEQSKARTLTLEKNCLSLLIHS